MQSAMNFILIPAAQRRQTVASAAASLLAASLRRLSQDLFGTPAVLLSYEESSKTFHSLDSLQIQKPGTIFAGTVLPDHFLLNHLVLLSACSAFKRGSGCIHFYNPAFFLFDSSAHGELALAGQRNGLAMCGRKSSRDLYGIAWSPRRVFSQRQHLHAALAWLTQTVERGSDPSSDLLELVSLDPSPVSPEHSPALRGISSPVAGRAPDAPLYLNTFFAEVLQPPPSGDVPAGDLAGEFRRLRDVSQTPWIFNALLNTIEYAGKEARLTSAPPELHISSTGLCNLSCRFCTYTPELGRPDSLTLAGLKNLPVLRWVRTLRLSAGLGEPTLNPHLPEILQWVAAAHPHISMNFFSNGVELVPSIQQALVDAKVRWINVSLNSAAADTWADLCGADRFAAVMRNLSDLKRLKRQRRSLYPLVFASAVLTSRSMHELPQMPALCAELGIDRLSGFPFFAFGYGGEGKFDSRECFQAKDLAYPQLYEQTVAAAAACGISLELPLPVRGRNDASIVADRPLRDFARIEQNEHRLDRLLVSLQLPADNKACFFLWKQASLGSVNRQHEATPASHYFYPCLGPLSGVNSVRFAPVDFSAPVDFLSLWNNPFFMKLRQAQQERGISPVCDLCMKHDTRDPSLFPRLNECLETLGVDKGRNKQICTAIH